jgi:uncharacterized transporter YbjL
MTLFLKSVMGKIPRWLLLGAIMATTTLPRAWAAYNHLQATRLFSYTGKAHTKP